MRNATDPRTTAAADTAGGNVQKPVPAAHDREGLAGLRGCKYCGLIGDSGCSHVSGVDASGRSTGVRGIRGVAIAAAGPNSASGLPRCDTAATITIRVDGRTGLPIGR